MRFSIPFDSEECQALQAGDWVLLSSEVPQESVNPPSLKYIGDEGGPVGVRHLKPSRQNPDEIVGELDSPKELGHQPRRPAATAAGGVTKTNKASAWADPVS